jgi:hypothetical protein
MQGSIEGLRDVHNLRAMDSRLLAPLAAWLGWKLKDYLDEDGQRNEIGFAAEFFKTVGAVPNIKAMVNRLTGWDAEVREFARNIVVSFDSSRLERLHTGLLYLDGSASVTPAYAAWLDSPGGAAPAISMQGRRAPPGTIDTTDANAMFKLRTHAADDETAYTYDCGVRKKRGRYDLDDRVWYNRQTIGVYIVPDVDTETFSPAEEIDRVRQIVNEFLPIQVRAVFFLLPYLAVEEPYDATQVVETAEDRGTLKHEETYGEGSDRDYDEIPGWRWFVTNDLAYRSVSVAGPVDTSSRTWHTGLSRWLNLP